LFPVAFYMYN